MSENYEGHCFEGQGLWSSQGEIENWRCSSYAIGQQSHVIMEGKILHSAGLLVVGGVGSVVTARCAPSGVATAPTSPSGQRPNYLAAVPIGIFRQARSRNHAVGIQRKGAKTPSHSKVNAPKPELAGLSLAPTKRWGLRRTAKGYESL